MVFCELDSGGGGGGGGGCAVVAGGGAVVVGTGVAWGDALSRASRFEAHTRGLAFLGRDALGLEDLVAAPHADRVVTGIHRQSDVVRGVLQKGLVAIHGERSDGIFHFHVELGQLGLDLVPPLGGELLAAVILQMASQLDGFVPFGPCGRHLSNVLVAIRQVQYGADRSVELVAGLELRTRCREVPFLRQCPPLFVELISGSGVFPCRDSG